MSDPYSKAVEAYKKGDSKNAIKHFKKAIKLADKINKQKIKGEILQTLAFAYTMDGQLQEGIKSMKASVIIFDKYKLYIKVVEGLAYIGALNFKIKQIELALKYYNEAQRIIRVKKIHNQCRELEADICADLGSIYDNKEKFVISLEKYNRALKLYRKTENKRGEARTYLDVGIMYSHQDNYDEAKTNIEKALKWLKKFNDLGSMADCHLTLGNIYKEQKNWSHSMTELKKALVIYETQNNPIGIAESIMGIGIAQGNIKGKELDAKKNLQQAIIFMEKLKDNKLEGICLAWLAKIKNNLGEPDAEKFKNKAVKILSKIGKEKLLTKIK